MPGTGSADFDPGGRNCLDKTSPPDDFLVLQVALQLDVFWTATTPAPQPILPTRPKRAIAVVSIAIVAVFTTLYFFC